MSNDFSLSDISLLSTGEKFFAMDRYRGRWTFLDRSELGGLRLLRARPETLTASERRSWQLVHDRLREAAFGVPLEESYGDLNTLILKLTKVCNYRCKYCYDLEPEDAYSHLPLPVALSALAEAIRIARRPAAQSAQPDLTVILHGGEPTLVFPTIQELVLKGEQFGARYGKKVRFCGQTNLSRVTPDFVEFSQQHHIGWGISLDGFAAINDQFRVLPSGGGTYSFFRDALCAYPEFIRSCSVLTVVTSLNEGQLLPIARHFRDCGMMGWGWTLFQAIGRARSEAGCYQFSVERVVESWNELLEAVESGEFDGFDVRPVSGYLENLVAGPGPNMCMRKHCGAARDLLSISPDGTIEACDCIDRRGPLANLGLVQIGAPNSLDAARQSERANLIRSRDVQRGKCDTCIWLSVCGGTCLAYAPSLHGVHEEHCHLAMNAFTRIVNSLARSNSLYRYWNSVRLARENRNRRERRAETGSGSQAGVCHDAE